MEDRALRVAPALESRPVLDSEPHITRFLGQPAQHNHIVQLYEREEVLYDHIAVFVAAGLTSGEPVIVIATQAHRTALVARLNSNAIDAAAATAAGQLTLLDAEATLSQFMIGDAPDRERFREVVAAVIEKSRIGREGTRVRVYGEMVDVLWRAGNRQAAIALEDLWNDLSHEHSFSLLCAYAMGNFYHAGDGGPFEHVCRRHTHVIPTISRLDDSDKRSREIRERPQLRLCPRRHLAGDVRTVSRYEQAPQDERARTRVVHRPPDRRGSRRLRRGDVERSARDHGGRPPPTISPITSIRG